MTEPLREHNPDCGSLFRLYSHSAPLPCDCGIDHRTPLPLSREKGQSPREREIRRALTLDADNPHECDHVVSDLLSIIDALRAALAFTPEPRLDMEVIRGKVYAEHREKLMRLLPDTAKAFGVADELTREAEHHRAAHPKGNMQHIMFRAAALLRRQTEQIGLLTQPKEEVMPSDRPIEPTVPVSGTEGLRTRNALHATDPQGGTVEPEGRDSVINAHPAALAPAPLGEPQTITAQQSTRTIASGAGPVIDFSPPASPLGERAPTGKCEGCGAIVTGDHLSGEKWGHTRSEHHHSCDGNCGSDCPVPVSCGPIVAAPVTR